MIERTVMQAMVNQVADHLRRQGGIAYNEEQCAYRNDVGQSCAVGCLISDEHYSSNLEGRIAQQKIVIDTLNMSGWEIPLSTSSFLGSLQSRLHDQYAQNPRFNGPFPEWFEKALQDFCSCYNLIFPRKLTPNLYPRNST